MANAMKHKKNGQIDPSGDHNSTGLLLFLWSLHTTGSLAAPRGPLATARCCCCCCTGGGGAGCEDCDCRPAPGVDAPVALGLEVPSAVPSSPPAAAPPVANAAAVVTGASHLGASRQTAHLRPPHTPCQCTDFHALKYGTNAAITTVTGATHLGASRQTAHLCPPHTPCQCKDIHGLKYGTNAAITTVIGTTHLGASRQTTHLHLHLTRLASA
eukprot:1160869-Pelagomonas_calceolata.AAC.5